MTSKKLATYAAEAVGTFMLAFVVMTVADGVFAALTIGLALVALVSIFGSISGAHLNPAITIGLLSQKKIRLNDAMMYVAAQIVGALGAWKIFEYFAEVTLQASRNTSDARRFFAEAIGTMVLAMGIAAVVAGKAKGTHAALTIGLSLSVAVLVASVGGGGIINPAIALGLQEVSFATLLAPLLGGAVGMSLYLWIFNSSEAKS